MIVSSPAGRLCGPRDADTARALARAKPWMGHLPKLTSLSAEVASALVTLEGPCLYLEGLTSLDAETAEVLSRCPKWSGVLAGVTGFEGADSVAVAAALAKRPGRLALPNLERVSPRTLAALIAKHDVVIPSLDALELIEEPDGGPTDDFVVPEAVPDSWGRLHRR